MEITKARGIASSIVAQLKPFCDRIEIAGSIRRGKAEVHDIDIVAIPSGMAFHREMQKCGYVSGGPKIYKVEVFVFDGNGKLLICASKKFTADIYIASEATWATLLLIRTGSANHNKMLCTLAKSKGMKLHADGSGLERVSATPNLFNQQRIAGGALPFPFGLDVISGCMFIECATETDIFKALGMPYKAPGERE